MPIDRNDWRRQFEMAMRPLSSSITASRYGMPPLDNAGYRGLVKHVEENPEAAWLLKEYLTRIHVDATDAIELIEAHPEVRDVFSGHGMDRATFVTMPGKGFRMELKQLAGYAARIGAIRGDTVAAAEVDEFLTLAGNGRLPGYEVAVIRGLTVEGMVRLGHRTKLTTHADAMERGLAKKPERESLDVRQDHETTKQTSVVFREMTWSPCLVSPPASLDMEERQPRADFAGGPGLGVVLDCLSLVTAQRVELVEILSCAPGYLDINPNFAPGTSFGFVIPDEWRAKQLTTEQASEIEGLLEAWPMFEHGKRRILELGLARLVSSIRRNRGHFWLEDRILDIAVALEVLYGLDRGELTYKLSTRAAHLLKLPEARVDLFDTVNELYRMRSRIVHGGSRMDPGTTQHVQEVAERGFKIGCDTLIELLDRGCMPDWKRLVLSAD